MHCMACQTECQPICNSLIVSRVAPRVHTENGEKMVHGIIWVYMISMMLSTGGMCTRAVIVQNYNLPCMIVL